MRKIFEKTVNLPMEDAFNGCLHIYQGKYLIFYNSFNELGYVNRVNNRNVYACFLDQDFNYIKGTNQLFSSYSDSDVRIFKHQNETYVLSVTKSYENDIKYGIKIYCVTIENNVIRINKSFCIRRVDGEIKDEKNWGVFSYEGDLYAVHKIVPHQIIKINLNEENGSTIHATTWKPNFCFYRTKQPNLYRGNVCPVLVGESYLSVFHTKVSYYMPSWKRIHRYYTGFYTFQAKPPFKVISYTKPVFLPSDVEVLSREKKEIIQCTFPTGLCLVDKKVIISGGENDIRQKVWIFEVNDIYRKLIKV